MEFTNGQRVRYTGTLVPRLIGQEGLFVGIGRNGWAVVDFDKDGEMKVAPDNLEAVETAKPVEPMRFVDYRVQPVIETWPKGADPKEDGGIVRAYQDEADWRAACLSIENEGEPYKAFWSLYGIDQDGLSHCIGDFQTEAAANEIKHAIYPKKPILAKVDVQAADAVADFLERMIPTHCPTPNTASWQEVADALRALTNDTDAIVTDFNDL